MRASATSRVSPHLTHEVRANATSKSDGATPFSLLLASVSPHAKTQGADKQADAAQKDDPAQDKSNDAAPVSQDAKAQSAAAQNTKPAKSDKDDADDKTDTTQNDATGQANPDAQPAQTDTTANTAPASPALALLTGQALPAVTTPDDNQDTDETAAIGQTSSSQAASDQALAAASAKQGPAQPQTTKPQAAPQSADTKTADIKGARKSAAPDAKPDTKTADDTAADIKAAAPASDAAPAKPAPAHADLAVNAPVTSPAVAPGTAPSAPGITQHVQVTAEAPKPNLPALAVEISAKAQSGAKQFDIRLDPPELGRVDVRLSIDATGKASAHLSADQPQTLELLQKDSTSLTRALRDAGLDVSQDGLNFSLRQQNQQAHGGHPDGGAGRQPGRSASFIATAGIDQTASTASIGDASRALDIRI